MIERKFWGRVKKHTTRRMSIQQALTIIGLPRERVYLPQPICGWADRGTFQRTRRLIKSNTRESFWSRDEYELQDIAADMRRIFHARLKEVRHDFPENHEQAVLLIGAYRQAIKLFRHHGI